MITKDSKKDNKNVQEIYKVLLPFKDHILEYLFSEFKDIGSFDREFNNRMWSQGTRRYLELRTSE